MPFHLFGASQSRHLPLALSLEGQLDLGALACGASAVLDQTKPGESWVLATPDAFEFAAGLFGLLMGGCRVILPPNLLPATLDSLRPHAAGQLDTLPKISGPIPKALQKNLPDGELVFWTSGSTGHPKQVTRQFSQLASEVDVLEYLFGASCGDGPFIATVPHHHIYGCLFRLLWPLATGRLFVTEPCGAPGCLLTALNQEKRPVLISSPAHLSRLPQLIALDEVRSAPCAVFSSGGPLKKQDACLWQRWVEKGVFEVYGSTESGGIAWRNQQADRPSEAWQPFPDVTLAALPDNALEVTCHRVGPSGRLRMEDAVIFEADGRFHLQGRLDRIVKVEEKRVSLPALEAALCTHSWVAHAAAVLLHTPRQMIGAVIVLKEGVFEDASSPSQRRLFQVTLGAHLAQQFDPIAIPKRWRVVPRLPTNEQGKVEQAALHALFWDAIL